MADFMRAFLKLVSSLVFLAMSTVLATPALAQGEVLRAVPEAQVGLWDTVRLTGGNVLAGSADEACRIQHQSYNPNATYLGAFYYSEHARECRWLRGIDGGPPDSNNIPGTLVFLACPPDHVREGSRCVLPQTLLPLCNGDCGSNPLSGTPQPNLGNPININSGLKVQAETDYATADGLFTVERQYLSRAGAGWQVLMPGFLELGGQFTDVVQYNSRSGAQDHFVAVGMQEPNNWAFTLPNFQGSSFSLSRRRLSMVTAPTTDRYTFKTDPNVSPTGPAEMRMDMANGEYILFRRANGTETREGWRRLVPVEHGKPGGYKIYFDYPDAGYFPYRVRDSLNREMLVTWIDAPAPGPRPGFSGGKVISQIRLPDTSLLDYSYDKGESSFTIPVPLWATQNGYQVGGVVAGAIKVVIEGPRDRMRTVTRRSAAGAVLWKHQFDYGYPYNPYAMTAIRDQNNASLSS